MFQPVTSSVCVGFRCNIGVDVLEYQKAVAWYEAEKSGQSSTSEMEDSHSQGEGLLVAVLVNYKR
jgi:hypothetical protein